VGAGRPGGHQLPPRHQLNLETRRRPVHRGAASCSPESAGNGRGVARAATQQRDEPVSAERSAFHRLTIRSQPHQRHTNRLLNARESNALVTGDDFVYLIDFGIAHDAAATKLTQTGSHPGTLGYMSPERLNTGTADARSDVYALACVLYECLTDTQPFPGESMEQQILGHLTLDPPKPSSRNASLAGLDAVIATGMAKDPDKRYQSAKELAVAARQALTDTPAPTLASPLTPKHAEGRTQRHSKVPPPQEKASLFKSADHRRQRSRNVSG
jgi:serine/threonine protein kinase